MDINVQALKEYLGAVGIMLAQLSLDIGHSKSYMAQVCNKGKMPTSSYRLMCHVLGVDEEMFTLQADSMPGIYWLNLIYNDKKVCVQLMHGEDVISGAWAVIRGDTQTDFAQAVSYATHMIYKFVEQNDLGS